MWNRGWWSDCHPRWSNRPWNRGWLSRRHTRLSDRLTLHDFLIVCFIDFHRAPLTTSIAPRATPKMLVVPHVVPTTPPAPCATPISMTSPVPPTAPASQHYSRCPWAAREPPAPPLLQQSPSAKAVPVAPPVNPHSMTTWAKRVFRLPANKLTLSSTSSSPLSLVPTSVHVALANPS
jgi:hypothetical protein